MFLYQCIDIIFLNLTCQVKFDGKQLLYLLKSRKLFMDLKYRIQKFLKGELLSKQTKLVDLARKSSIPYHNLQALGQGFKANPELRSLLRIANYFKCSLDEVTGRDHKYLPPNPTNYQFHDLSTEEINSNLKQFIMQKIQQDNISLSKLSLNIGFSSGLLSDFIREDRSPNSLGSAPVAALADYFDISIDQMIGRSVTASGKIQEVNQDIPKSLKSLDQKDKDALKQIKSTLSSTQQKATTPSPHPAQKAAKAKDTLPSR